MPDRKPIILLVEDNSTDVLLLHQAFEAAAADVHLHGVIDGLEALDFLHRRGAHTDAPRPDLVLLDINLPRCNGWEVLADVKTDTSLRRIPVIVLTTSTNEDDIARAYDLHANAYMIKPMAFDEFVSAVGMLHCFWLTAATLTRS